METSSDEPRTSQVGDALSGLRVYAELASELASGVAAGLTEATRQRALTTARTLVAAGESNSELVLSLVRAEVERQLARLPLPSAQEVAQLRARVEELERAVARLERRGSTAGAKARRATTATKRAPRKRAATEDGTGA